ncbi:hypothetical protein L249_6366 [Ophiocordyceps polyrhachis-furcata BCC 54312]|uniref:Uncharacterized protein n=1 Tax=Ophiocordyceps polyrhachis-furcata BCC 54312 TaxID=1330021 RepID=A0A367L1C1_9HYPO|nr:hypothetical protein L249_6366 [Ophiocordyceps polyrhachis-furcata BCC 54312]
MDVISSSDVGRDSSIPTVLAWIALAPNSASFNGSPGGRKAFEKKKTPSSLIRDRLDANKI